MMLEVLDKNRRKVAYLENAFRIGEEIKLNSISTLFFSMPIDDKKINFLQPFTYVKAPHGLYRILPKKLESGNTDIVSYECEHVIATLIDNVIFGSRIYGNLGIYTHKVINYVLNKQKTKNWILDKCEFSRQFEYAWENETLAAALFSIPKPLKDDYIWEFDTDNYPWKLSLKKIDKSRKPTIYIMPKKNQIMLEATSDPRELFTRIYPLGYGEGVNQLNIEDVNSGVPYIQAEKEYIEKYGLIERVWIDRRYENPESLKDSAQVMLDHFKEPTMEFSVDFALFSNDKINVGDKIEVINNNIRYTDFITTIQYDYDNILKSRVIVSNKTHDIASTVADLADRQRIEMTYSQGATQVYSQSIQVNADNKYGAELNFFIPAEMRIINKVLIKIKLDSFRAYSKAVKGGGGTSESTSYGGGDYMSTSSGGGEYKGGSTDSGGGMTMTTHGENDVDGDNVDFRVWSNTPGWSGHVTIYHVYHHEHKVYLQDHRHGFEIRISDHTHSVKIPEHKHRFTLMDHTHEIEYGIYRYYSNLKYFTLKINGKEKITVNSTNGEIDITEYLLDNKKKISRGTWHRIEVVPNDLSYISLDMMLQGFVQSRGDYAV